MSDGGYTGCVCETSAHGYAPLQSVDAHCACRRRLCTTGVDMSSTGEAQSSGPVETHPKSPSKLKPETINRALAMFDVRERFSTDVHTTVRAAVRGSDYDDYESDVRANARMYDISGLRQHHRVANTAVTDALPIPFDQYEFAMDKTALRQHFAKYGLRSGVNPGILWMSDAELAQTRVEESELTENLRESMQIAGDRRQQRLDEQKNIRLEYERKLKSYDKQVAEYQANIEAEKQRQLREQEDDKKRLHEARVQVGYIADADDPRVQAILAKDNDKKPKKVGWKKR